MGNGNSGYELQKLSNLLHQKAWKVTSFLLSFFSFISYAVPYSLCPQKSVGTGNGGVSSFSDLVWDLYDVHCCMVNFH